MKVPCANCLSEANGVARAVHVGPLLVFGAGLEVIDGGEMKEVLYPVLQRVNIGFGDAQFSPVSYTPLDVYKRQG